VDRNSLYSDNIPLLSQSSRLKASRFSEHHR